MPEIPRFYGIIIRMYFQNHNPPHFHAEYQGMKAEYSIETLEVLAGKIQERAHSMVLEWAFMHRNGFDICPNFLKEVESVQSKSIQIH